MDIISLKAIPIKNIRQFKIYKTRNPNYKRKYIIWNTDLAFQNGHTHVHTLSNVEQIIQCILNQSVPTRKCEWKDYNDLITSTIRICTDENFITHLINCTNSKFRR